MEKKVIGILGGMGPLATADLFEKIVRHTQAASDQEHPRICIDSNTKQIKLAFIRQMLLLKIYWRSHPMLKLKR